MIGTEVGRQVGAPIEVVWSTIADVGAYPDRVRSYVAVDFLTTQTGGVDAAWRQTRTVFGREHAQVLRVVRWDPPSRLETVALESGARYRTSYQLEALGGGTRVTVRFEVVATNPLGSLVQRLFGHRLMASTRAAMERDIEDLCAAAERATPAT
jgi:hypothetical protein